MHLSNIPCFRSYFTDHWNAYLKERNILDGESDPKFPKRYDVGMRDAFYTSLSYSGWGGASGHDAPMIAYGLLFDILHNVKNFIRV